MTSYEWFIEEVESIARSLNLASPFEDQEVNSNGRGRWEVGGEITLATENDHNDSPERNEYNTVRIENIDPDTSNNDQKSGDKPMAFEISVSPLVAKKTKTNSTNPVLRSKKGGTPVRPHTVHEGDRAELNDVEYTNANSRTRTFSNPTEMEQDENQPPEGVAFEITEIKDDTMKRKRDRILRKQLEREEEQRRKKLSYEELKRTQEQEKMRNDEYLNNLKKLDQERREAILRNHKNAKSPISKPKVAKKNTTKKLTIPSDPFGTPGRVSRSQSTTLRREPTKEKEWDTMSCVSTLTTTRLFREPSSKSNKSLMLQALKFSSLPGPVNAKTRKEVEDSLNNSGAMHFMALYKQAKYKGMYEVEQLEDIFKILKIHGTGPKEVTEAMIADLLKYNSGMKSFQSVGSKTLSPAVDGFCLTNACWQTRRPKAVKI